MTWLHRLFHRRKNEEELEKELRFHLDLHTNDLIAQGHSPEEARRQARLALGGPEQVKEMCRDTRGSRWLGDLLLDLRYAGRMWSQSPAFTLFIVNLPQTMRAIVCAAIIPLCAAGFMLKVNGSG